MTLNIVSTQQDELVDIKVDIPKIFIVEDDPIFNELLMQTLSSDGYNVTGCNTGREAIKILRHNAFDIILLDVGLPDISGFEIIQEVDFENSQPMIFVMTGNGTLDSALEAIRQKAYNFLIKPFDLLVLKQEVKNAIRYKQMMTDHSESKKALVDSEKCLSDLINNSIAGIGVIHDKQLVYRNTEFEKIFLNYRGSFGKDFYCFIHPDDVLVTQRSYDSVALGIENTADLNFRFYPSGDVDNQSDCRWFQCRLGKLKFQGKKSILFNIVDITDTKEIERQLIIKNKMFSLGQVAAGVAHEIRNPLTGINGFVYALDKVCKQNDFEGNNNQMIHEIITQIQDASSVIESVIKRVMDFSKPGSPKMRLTNINKSLESAIKLSAMALRKYKIKIETSLADALPLCYADSALMEQVILNLLNNASQAFQENADLKIVRVESFAKKNTVYIIVSDSGPGIPLESRGRIFEPFFSTKEEGAGIGLNIVQRIIADHNGSICFSESHWGGAEFTIKMPIERRICPR